MINQTRKKYSMLFHPVNDLKYDAHDTMTTITPTENMISIFSHFLRRLHDILSSNRNIQRLKRRKRTRNEVASRRCVCCSMHYLQRSRLEINFNCAPLETDEKMVKTEENTSLSSITVAHDDVIANKNRTRNGLVSSSISSSLRLHGTKIKCTRRNSSIDEKRKWNNTSC